MNIICSFYNVENLFDTIDDPKTKDNAFTPAGELEWDDRKYYTKLEHIAEMLSTMKKGNVPAFIGLCEVENRTVLKELISHRSLRHEPYEIIHEDSHDVRGIDIAFIYSKDAFRYIGHEMISIDKYADRSLNSRDIMHVWGKMAVDDSVMHFYINHWPSRRDGQQETEYKRIAAAKTLEAALKNAQLHNGDSQMIVMGDFNDSPSNKTMIEILEAKEKSTDPNDLINLATQLEKQGKGTLNHEGDWYLFDQILVSNNLLDSGNWDIAGKQMKIHMVEDAIYRDRKEGSFKPNRTYAGGKYRGGYSDHFPVFIELKHKG